MIDYGLAIALAFLVALQALTVAEDFDPDRIIVMLPDRNMINDEGRTTLIRSAE